MSATSLSLDIIIVSGKGGQGRNEMFARHYVYRANRTALFGWDLIDHIDISIGADFCFV
jgi:hypothetical protein